MDRIGFARCAPKFGWQFNFTGVAVFHDQVVFDEAERGGIAALAGMMVEGLLNCGSETVRTNTCKLGERLANIGGGLGHAQLLDILSDLSVANLQPYYCSDYYKLLTEIVHTMPGMPATVTSPLIHWATEFHRLLRTLKRVSRGMNVVESGRGGTRLVCATFSIHFAHFTSCKHKHALNSVQY
jgi:hypothetical protein